MHQLVRQVAALLPSKYRSPHSVGILLQGKRIGIAEVRRRLESGENALILDVRSAEEYRGLHAKGAVSLPLDEVSRESVERCLATSGARMTGRIWFICRSGRRADEACMRVFEHFPEAEVIEGGTLAWAQAGLAVTQGPEV